jgi:hypothetical protein
LNAAIEREARRQSQLLAAIRDPAQTDELQAWLADDARHAELGLRSYRANAVIATGSALADSFPTLRALLGDESFAALSRAFWRDQPPLRGDLAWYGAELADFVAGDAQLSSEPYLADCARVDWALHRIEFAADAPALPTGLALLGEVDPGCLRVTLQSGLTVIASAWPVVRIHAAHRSSVDVAAPGPDAAPARDRDRFAEVRQALAAGEGETALVWRDSWRGRVDAIDPAQREFLCRLAAGESLAAALCAAGEGFAFEAWLIAALQRRWLVAIERDAGPGSA